MGKNTKGAFGPNPWPRPPKRKLAIRKLVPPPQVQHTIIKKDKEKLHRNPFVRIFQKFFLRDGF